MPRHFLALACTAGVVACSESSSSPADRVELRTDATSYEVVTGVPRFLSLTLLNNGPSSIDATLCAAGTGTITSEMSYQVYQGGLWVDVPYGRVDCGAQGVLQSIGAGEVLTVSSATPLPVAGSYRILMPWAVSGSTTSSIAISNRFVVTSNSEPTAGRAARENTGAGAITP